MICQREDLRCTSPATATTIWTPCSDRTCSRAPDEHLQVCDVHRKFADSIGRSSPCRICKAEGRHGRVTLTAVIAGYDYARDVYLSSGLIADKETMIALVTETEPAEWDTFTSILPRPPEPVRLRPGWHLVVPNPPPRWVYVAFILWAIIGICASIKW